MCAWSSTCSRSARSTPLGDLGHGAAEPGGQRVGVHRHGQVRLEAVTGREGVGGLVLEEPGLAGQPEQHLTCGSRPARGRALDDHLADDRLQGADALADRRRRHVQGTRGRVERAVVGNGHQCLELGRVEAGVVGHEAMLMLRQELSLVCMSGPSLRSSGARRRGHRHAHRSDPHHRHRRAERVRAATGSRPRPHRRRRRDLRGVRPGADRGRRRGGRHASSRTPAGRSTWSGGSAWRSWRRTA